MCMYEGVNLHGESVTPGMGLYTSGLQVLWGECISGALYKGDFIRLAQKVGFDDPRSLSSAPIEVTDPELKDVVGNAQFSSITYRCATR